MQNKIKLAIELDKLVTESSLPTNLKPNMTKFQRIVEIVNSDNKFAKDLVMSIKSKLFGKKHPKT